MNARETPYRRGPGYPEHYRDWRFAAGAGLRTHRRESRALGSLLARVPEAAGPWLDMPAGTGRLSGLLPGSAVRVDRDPAMLAAGTGNGPRVCAAASRLPFTDGAFAGALCMRLMHHLADRDERIAILAELRRVSRGPVLVSYFEALSLQHLRRVLTRALGRPRSGRCAVTWRRFRSDLLTAGLTPIARRHLRPLVSEQCLVLARRV